PSFQSGNKTFSGKNKKPFGFLVLQIGARRLHDASASSTNPGIYPCRATAILWLVGVFYLLRRSSLSTSCLNAVATSSRTMRRTSSSVSIGIGTHPVVTPWFGQH